MVYFTVAKQTKPWCLCKETRLFIFKILGVLMLKCKTKPQPLQLQTIPTIELIGATPIFYIQSIIATHGKRSRPGFQT